MRGCLTLLRGNMSTETVSVNEQEQVPEAPLNDALENAQEQAVSQENDQVEQESPKTVPLSVLQKERKKRQEAEEQNRYYREQEEKLRRQQQEDDQYETLTRAEGSKLKADTIREVDERSWMRSNPEKLEHINERLGEFLKQRPHLASAIEAAPNRYEEAWMLMEALSPRQKAALKTTSQTQTNAPGSPSAVPKAAGMNQAIDVMSMTDAEFNAWRQSQKKHR